MHAFIIANADTLMSKFPADLMAEAFPTVEVRKKLGRHETRLSIKKVLRALGPVPEYSWREAKTNGMAQQPRRRTLAPILPLESTNARILSNLRLFRA